MRPTWTIITQPVSRSSAARPTSRETPRPSTIAMTWLPSFREEAAVIGRAVPGRAMDWAVPGRAMGARDIVDIFHERTQVPVVR
jgi:hypothetical protein